ncbi:MAG: hypothetical protein WAP74_04645 [Patescibacteria group bacterium]
MTKSYVYTEAGTYNPRGSATNGSWAPECNFQTVTVTDTTPPTITNLTAGSITETGATITWTTAGEPASTTHTVKYGTTSGSYDSYPNTKSAGSGTSASGAL